MTSAELKQRIAAGEALLGTFLKTPHPHVVEVLSTANLDLLCIDAEHAPFDRRDIDQCVLAARAGAMPVLVRPASAAPEQLMNALDCGAAGVLIPHVRSVEAAVRAANLCRYGREGRGYAGSTRAACYGLKTMPEHIEQSNAGIVVVAQIEDAEAIDDIEAIARVPGIDALFIGRADLTVSLGFLDQDDAAVVAALERIVEACRKAARPCGLFLARPGDVRHWKDRGARLFLLGSDHGFLRIGAAALRDAAGF
jgi:staphyloferrin B biosynthesis citrate synthase